MSAFTNQELAYLRSGRRLARIATADAKGLPQVTPVGMWWINEELDTVDVSGRNFTATKKYRNVQENPQASIVIDDLASVDPWRPRAVMVQGHAQALPDDGSGHAVIRIHPDTVVSWGLAE